MTATVASSAPAPVASSAPAPVRITDRCTGCGACLLTCPEHALRPTGRLDEPLVALASLCTGCGECVEICPADAVNDLPLLEAAR